MFALYRYEKKYVISETQMEIITRRLNKLMRLDTHQSVSGYNVRSLYFDTQDDDLLRQVQDGEEDHTKYRIRIYNCVDDVIKAEKKVSHYGKKKKMVAGIDRLLCDSLLANYYIPYYYQEKTSVLSELIRYVNSRYLVPKIIIDYNRMAFVSSYGNIRITIDRYIPASRDFVNFFNKDTDSVIVLPKYSVLEIKYDTILPAYINSCFSDLSLERMSFSKYQLGREKLDEWR